MSQSTVLAGAVLIAFVVYLLMNGKLQTYWQLMIGGGQKQTATTGSLATTPGVMGAALPGLLPGVGTLIEQTAPLLGLAE